MPKIARTRSSQMSDPVPLESEADGVVRVKGTRVTLDTVVAAFAEGATAEEIAPQYPTLALSDIYAVLSYNLRRREEVTLICRSGTSAGHRCGGRTNPALIRKACAND